MQMNFCIIAGKWKLTIITLRQTSQEIPVTIRALKWLASQKGFDGGLHEIADLLLVVTVGQVQQRMLQQ